MLTFYYAPMTRADTTRWLLEELGIPYVTEIVDIRGAEGAPEGYRKIQPHKKVPAIVHDGVTITERAAIATYLCDAFPEADLAPPIGDTMRGPYLSWLVYVDSVLDPVMSAHGLGWAYPKFAVSFGGFEDMVSHVTRAVTDSPYAAGDRFTAADVSLASAIGYALDVAKAMPETAPLRDYVNRCQDRPAYRRFMAAYGR